MNELTPWFFATTPPVRPGVYETRNRTIGWGKSETVQGYSFWGGSFWGYTRSTPELAAKSANKSSQQSKEWRGILK